MHLHEFLRRRGRAILRRRHWRRIYLEFAEFTMIPEASFIDNLQIADALQNVPGCVVECGVWRGGMSAALCRLLGPERDYFLFDSFQGLPLAKAIDGAAAIRWQQEQNSPDYHDNCSAPLKFARTAMERAGARSFHLMEGWFEKTLPGFVPPKPIALLRLDGDWYESTLVSLENLFHRVADNGIVILDDYYTWDGCSRALHDFLSRNSATERIRSLGHTCYLSKIPKA